MAAVNDRKHSIPLYKDIDEFLSAAGFRQRTVNPNFIIIRLEDTYPDVRAIMPPFRKEFYLMAMATNSGKSEFFLDDHAFKRPKNYLVFQSPGHILSWKRDEGLKGYLIYFKDECFSFFRNSIKDDFAFFDLLHTNFFPIDSSLFDDLKDDFEVLLREQQRLSSFSEQVLYTKFLALLFKCKSFYTTFNAGLVNQNGAHVTTQRYLNLINNYYLEKRTVEEFASLLHITPGHLNELVKKSTGKTASSFITEKLVSEAKNLIVYTPQDIAEIAYELHFTSPAHFNRFFKQHTGKTPLEFRKARLPDSSPSAK